MTGVITSETEQDSFVIDDGAVSKWDVGPYNILFNFEAILTDPGNKP